MNARAAKICIGSIITLNALAVGALLYRLVVRPDWFVVLVLCVCAFWVIKFSVAYKRIY